MSIAHNAMLVTSFWVSLYSSRKTATNEISGETCQSFRKHELVQCTQRFVFWCSVWNLSLSWGKGKRSTGTIIPNLNLVPAVCGKAGLTCSFLFSFGFRVWCIHLTIFFPCPWSFQGGVTSGRLGREIWWKRPAGKGKKILAKELLMDDNKGYYPSSGLELLGLVYWLDSIHLIQKRMNSFQYDRWLK